jgi:hypothetical protein
MAINRLLSSRIFPIIVIAAVLIFLIFQKYQDKKNNEKNKKVCIEARNREFSGVVSKAFFDDDINVKAFVIYFTNGEKYVNPIFEKSLSGSVSEGDSIYKKPGTFKIVLFRKGYEKPIVVEDSIDCGKLYR